MLKVIFVPLNVWETQFGSLAREAERAHKRHLKAAPGDRQERQKYNSICSQIEILTLDYAIANPHSLVFLNNAETKTYLSTLPADSYIWNPFRDYYSDLEDKLSSFRASGADNGILIHMHAAFSRDTTETSANLSGTPVPAAKIWRSSKGRKGLAAVTERWEQQLESATTDDVPVVPSGVSNRVLTEGLRKYVDQNNVKQSGQARVIYRDGSEARPFPLGLLPLSIYANTNAPIFRVALLSMRHPEMDVEVDAAWLRNRDISQVRPMAETDDIVYRTTLTQLTRIADQGPRIIRLYQTGLEPAVVGFYRALAEHLAQHQTAVAVEPHYYTKTKGFEEGTPWFKQAAN